MSVYSKYIMIFLVLIIPVLVTFIGLLLLTNEIAPEISISENLLACEKVSVTKDANEYRCVDAYNDKIRQYRASYDKWSLQYRGNSMAWQHISSILFFILFSGVLVFGLFLTYREFNKETTQAINLKIASGGLEITSEIVGVVILVISLAFTYLYVDRLYPISEVNSSQSQKSNPEQHREHYLAKVNLSALEATAVDTRNGIVMAIDITHDPSNGCNMHQITRSIVGDQDSRTGYIIYNREICSSNPHSGRPAWTWRPYSGRNPHTKHAHFSVAREKLKYDGLEMWKINSTGNISNAV